MDIQKAREQLKELADKLWCDPETEWAAEKIREEIIPLLDQDSAAPTS